MTTLYRMFGQDGLLLYVGIAGNPGRRFQEHAGDKPWWGEVASIRTEHFDTREAAAQAELHAIRAEHPRWNIAGKRGDQPPIPLAPPNTLVDRYFLGTADNQIQGVVAAEPSPGIFLVELFSWLNGVTTHMELVPIADMAGWRFYDDAKWMVDDYEARVAALWKSAPLDIPDQGEPPLAPTP